MAGQIRSLFLPRHVCCWWRTTDKRMWSVHRWPQRGLVTAVLAATTAPARTMTPSRDRDHGSSALGGCDAKSEIPGPADLAPRLVIEWTASLARRAGGKHAARGLLRTQTNLTRLDHRGVKLGHMPESVNVYEAKTHLSQLLDRAAAGEEIVIARAGRPVARLVPLADSPSRQRSPGGWRGKV